MTRVEGSQLLYTAGGRPAYLPDGREVSVVVTTEDGSVGVLTDHDRWYVATLRTVSGMTTATVLKVHTPGIAGANTSGGRRPGENPALNH